MQGLLASMKKQQRSMSINPGSKGPSRSGSIASSMADEDDHQSDESTAATAKPTTFLKKKGGFNSQKEIKPPPQKSRIDSNMVKLKLLDATRKAIIDKTIKPRNSQGTQTDTFKTKLCKDVEVDNQAELVCPTDQSTETEMEYVAVKSADGKLLVTQTSAVNTDEISKDTVSTQTAMPRSNVSFKKAYDPRHKIQYFDEAEEEEQSDDDNFELSNLERKFSSGSSKKNKLTRQKSQNKQRIDIVIEDESSDVIAIETFPTDSPKSTRSSRSRSRSRSRRDSDSDYDEVYEEPKVIEPRPRSKVDEPGYHWHDLDFPEQKVELPRHYFTDGPTPWSNFQDLILGRRFLESKFSPLPSIPQRPQQFQYVQQPYHMPQQQPINNRHVTWSEPQVRVVNELVREANGLLDMFDQVAMLLGPDIKLHNVSEVEEFVMPPSKYDEEMTKACEKLEANLKKLDDIEASRNRKQREMQSQEANKMEK